MARSVRQSLLIRDELYERIIFDCEKSSGGGTDVYFSFMPPPGHLLDLATRWLLLHVTGESLLIYPFKESASGFVPKYDKLRRIFVTAHRTNPYREPQNHDEVAQLLTSLPEGLESNPLNGLGFSVQDRFIPETISAVADQINVLVHGGEKPPFLEHDLYVISELYLKRLVRGMRSIASRYLREAKTDKRILAYNSLLTPIGPDEHPFKQKKLSAEAVFELVKIGKVASVLPNKAQRNLVDLVSKNAQSIARDAPETLYELVASIEQATLAEMIAKYEVMLGNGLSETKWQRFFEANTFILSMIFSVPTIFLGATPYVSGKRIGGMGGKFSDFLMRGQGTGNVALAEIKGPSTCLLTPYRDEQPGPSKELVGAITQVLGQRRRLATGWHGLKGEDDGALSDTELYSPQAIVIIGLLPCTKPEREAFECFRQVLKDVAIVTYDELLLKLKYLHHALKGEEKNREDKTDYQDVMPL